MSKLISADVCPHKSTMELEGTSVSVSTAYFFLNGEMHQKPFLFWDRSLFQMRAGDVVFLASPLTFDPSVVDMFLALSSGVQLLIVPSVIKKMPRRLARLLFKDHKTTVLQVSVENMFFKSLLQHSNVPFLSPQVTPTLLVRFGHHILKQEVLSSDSSLRVLALGGEACPSPALLRSWKHQDNKTQIYNIYGVTEVSCWACCYKIPESLLQSGDL